MNDSLESAITKFLKFGVAGLTGIIIDFGVTWALKEKL
ncbi:MAG: hypothetical protein JWQ96_3360, partial [Segetibacter sp.]|nr:hypothetical protein [Segetibacter sp.]